MACTNRRIGRSTTCRIARLIRKPITTTEAAVSVSTHARVRKASRSERSREKRHATAPATVPASVIGAITSQ